MSVDTDRPDGAPPPDGAIERPRPVVDDEALAAAERKFIAAREAWFREREARGDA